ncbi:MAG TPA: alpha/beta fold hydrolase [Burkholderiaceae bacterium]
MSETAQTQDCIARLDARAHHHDVTFEGRRVHWRSFGAGPALVLLHGGHGSWLHWARNIEALAQRHTLWLPDLPGFGDSDEASVPHDINHLVQAVAATLDVLVGPDTPVDLAAFSFGGVVAVHLARARTIKRMALLGTAGHDQPRGEMAPLINWRLAQSATALQAAHRHNLAALMLHDPDAIDALALAIHTQSCAHTRFRSKAISRSTALRALLRDMHLPLLLAWGEHDVTAAPPATAAAHLIDGHAQRQWHQLPGAGHWVQYERADAVNTMLLDWFATSGTHPHAAAPQ